MSVINKEAMDQHIDAKVVGNERAIMQKVLLRLDPAERENVVYIDEDDNIYATNPALKNGFSVTHYNDNTISETGIIDIAMPLDIDNGPYRRISTYNGFSWMSGSVYLPGAGNKLYIADGNKETPYVYIGGTYTASNNTVTEVDAGMQFNTGKHDWSLFISVNKQYSFYSTRYLAGQTITLTYYVTSANKVEIKATGRNVDGTKVTYVKNATASGWNTAGTNCAVKRVTAIAQSPQNLSSGSYIKDVQWSNWIIGKSSSNNATWSTQDTKANVIYPSGIYVKYTMTNHANDTVSIIL